MKKIIILVLAVSLFSSCHTDKNKHADEMIEGIERMIENGEWGEALDSITLLRNNYPNAIEARKRALELWQEASLMQAQEEVMKADSAMQATLQEIDKAESRLQANLLRNKYDSLKARYDAQCGVVRIIRAKKDGK